MATQFKIKGNQFIVEDSTTHVRYVSVPVNTVRPLRRQEGAENWFGFANNSPTVNNYNITKLNMIGLVDNFDVSTLGELPTEQRYWTEFADIVDGDNVASWATADDLDLWLCQNLGGDFAPVSVKNSIEENGGDLQLVGDLSSSLVELYYGFDPAGNRGYHSFPVQPATYLKDEVIVTSSSANFNSNAPIDIPDLSYVIVRDGDYVLYALINMNNDQNEEFEMYYAINGATETNEPVWTRMQKNQDDSVQGTWSLNGLIIGDVITIQANTRGDNVDLESRKMIIQSWG